VGTPPSSSRHEGGDLVMELLDSSRMMPAVGQGALGLECRADDAATLTLLRQLEDGPSRQAVTAERAFLKELGGGCQLPIGALATVAAGRLVLHGCVLDPDGQRRLGAKVEGPVGKAEAAGQQLAKGLLERGARELLL